MLFSSNFLLIFNALFAYFILFYFEKSSHYIIPVGFNLIILQLQHSGCLGNRCVPTHSALEDMIFLS